MKFVLAPVARAIPYIQDETVGAGGLARIVGTLELNAGQVHAYVPEDEQDQATKFATGSFSSAVELEAVRVLAEDLVEARGLTRDPAKVLICEFADGAAVRPASPPSNSDYPTVWLEDAPSDGENGELWFAAAGAEANMIEEMLRELLWFPAFGVLTSQTSDAGLEDGSTLRYDVLRELVTRAEMVICGAWDASNYLLWTPATSTRRQTSPNVGVLRSDD